MIDLVPLGRIGRPHGILGDVRVLFFNADSPPIKPGDTIWLMDGKRGAAQVTVLDLRPHQDQWILSLEESRDRTQAARMTGKQIAVPRSALPETGDDEYYVRDLVGLTAKDREGGTVGRVVHTYFSGAHEVLVIRGDQGELDVPFAEDFIGDVDLEQGVLVLQGLFRELPWSPARRRS